MSAAGGTRPERPRTTGTCQDCGAFPVEGYLVVTVDERTELVSGHACPRKPKRVQRPRDSW